MRLFSHGEAHEQTLEGHISHPNFWSPAPSASFPGIHHQAGQDESQEEGEDHLSNCNEIRILESGVGTS